MREEALVSGIHWFHNLAGEVDDVSEFDLIESKGLFKGMNNFVETKAYLPLTQGENVD